MKKTHPKLKNEARNPSNCLILLPFFTATRRKKLWSVMREATLHWGKVIKWKMKNGPDNIACLLYAKIWDQQKLVPPSAPQCSGGKPPASLPPPTTVTSIHAHSWLQIKNLIDNVWQLSSLLSIKLSLLWLGEIKEANPSMLAAVSSV